MRKDFFRILEQPPLLGRELMSKRVEVVSSIFIMMLALVVVDICKCRMPLHEARIFRSLFIK
jgi:hypothetical protein